MPHCTVNHGIPLPCQKDDERIWVTTTEFSKYVPRAAAVRLAQYPQHWASQKRSDKMLGVMLIYHWLLKKSHNEILWKTAKPSNMSLLMSKHFTHWHSLFLPTSQKPYKKTDNRFKKKKKGTENVFQKAQSLKLFHFCLENPSKNELIYLPWKSVAFSCLC